MSATQSSNRFIEAKESDVAAIGAFFWAMWREAGPNAAGFAGATESVIAEIAEPVAIRARIGGPDRRMFLAYRDEVIVGFAATKAVDQTTVELAGVVVLQTMVGQGIGTPLVAAAVDAARKHGFELMTVSTEVDNQLAIGFYRRRGFTPTGNSTTVVDGTEVPVVNLELEL